MRCGSPNRAQVAAAFGDKEDKWIKRGRFRYCSYCGSLHPEDVTTILAEGGQVGLTDKPYKSYLEKHRDIDATGKFYGWHAPKSEEDPTWWENFYHHAQLAQDRLNKMMKS